MPSCFKASFVLLMVETDSCYTDQTFLSSLKAQAGLVLHICLPRLIIPGITWNTTLCLSFTVSYRSIVRGKPTISFSTTSIFKYHGGRVYPYTVYALVEAQNPPKAQNSQDIPHYSNSQRKYLAKLLFLCFSSLSFWIFCSWNY